MSCSYRLGIDIGTNSLGWCLLRLDGEREPSGILEIGVRIFKDARDPQSRESLAATRRAARAMRKQRDRRLDRKRRLMDALIRHGLMPSDSEERKKLHTDDKKMKYQAPNPYQLRAEGLDRPLTPYQFGRALFHLNQRRGFKSNLKTDRKERAGKEGSSKVAGKKLGELLGGQYRTLGEFLFKSGIATIRQIQSGKLGTERKLVRFRPVGMKAGSPIYEVYPTRAMYQDEFEKLWDAQTGFGLSLSDPARDEIRKIIFHQRDLKPVPVGKCRFNPEDKRAPEALPIAQRFRILQEINNLEWIDIDRRQHPLKPDQRVRILEKLERQRDVKFDDMRKHLAEDIGFSQIEFNLESERRKKLDGDKVAYEMKNKKRFGDRWFKMSLEEQNSIIERLLEEEDEARLTQIATGEWGLTEEQAEAAIEAPLPVRHYRLGRKAIRDMLPYLEKGDRYHEAARNAGYDHAMLPDGEIFEKLPYYGERLVNHITEIPSASDPGERRYGRLPNPTVHVALNQLRRVVNELIERHGSPTEITVELARDLPLGAEDLKAYKKQQDENQKRNERLKEEILKLLTEAGATQEAIDRARERGDAVLRMRLWEDLGPIHDRRCPYSLKPIGIRLLFDPQIQIDHILPRKDTLDDGYANKTLCFHQANSDKGKRSPYDAFHNRPGYDWEKILLRSQNLPKNKRWRFSPDAMEKAKKLDRFGMPRELADQFGAADSFLARHLVDTRYISRVTREYLTAICDPRKVWPITGSLTAMLRGKWGLNGILKSHNIAGPRDEKGAQRKTRLDHRHHAVDAFVVACTTRAMLQKVASASDQYRERVVARMPDPWPGFFEELQTKANDIIVSFRPDHGSTGIDPITGRTRTTGKFHLDTAYFPLSEPRKEDGASWVVSRKPIAGIESEEEIADIPDRMLRETLRAEVNKAMHGKNFSKDKEGEKEKKKAIKETCAKFVAATGIKKVKVKERLNVIRILDRNGKAYKAYKGDSNDYMEVWRLPNGEWEGQIVPTFDANRPNSGGRLRPHPAAKKLMTLYNDDMVRLVDESGEERTLRIVKMSKQTVVMADHMEAGNLKDRDAEKNDVDPFKYFSKNVASLRNLKFRKLRVSPSGIAHDPGPPAGNGK